jgi:hypothetical protein
MPRLTFSQSIAAGAQFDPWSNWQYRYLPWRGHIRVSAWTTAVGVTQEHRAGSEQLQAPSPVDIGGAAAGNLPTIFDVDPIDFVAAPGDLISSVFTNTTGGALNVMGIIDVNPAG